jgi:hypothetical protein
MRPRQWSADPHVNANMVSLWDLLTAVCSVMPIGGALASAQYAKVGFGGYTLAVTIGLALGVCGAWTMRAVGKTVAARIRRQTVSMHQRYFRALYFAAVVWIVFALFLGGWVSSALMRLVV